MFIKFLRYIRSQPKIVRDQYALAISATFTGLVALVWFFNNFWMQSGEVSSLNNKPQENSVPFASLVTEVKGRWQEMKEAMSNLKASSSQTASVIKINASNSRNINLSEEEIKVLNEKKNANNTNWQATTGTSSEPIYQEVQIVIVSSTEATTTGEDFLQ